MYQLMRGRGFLVWGWSKRCALSYAIVNSGGSAEYDCKDILFVNNSCQCMSCGLVWNTSFWEAAGAQEAVPWTKQVCCMVKFLNLKGTADVRCLLFSLPFVWPCEAMAKSLSNGTQQCLRWTRERQADYASNILRVSSPSPLRSISIEKIMAEL